MRLLVIFISLLVSWSCLKGQANNIQNSVIVKNNGLYHYQNNSYHFDELGFVFKENPILTNQFTTAVSSYKIGKILGYTTLGLLGGGIFATAVDRRDMYCGGIYCFTTGDVIGIISILFVSPITGTIALISHCNGISKMNTLIDSFNKIQLDAFGRKIEQPQLGLATSGIGISISF